MNKHLTTILAAATLLAAPASLRAASANHAADIEKCVSTSKEYSTYEAKLREAADLPDGRDAARKTLGSLMAAVKAFPEDVKIPATEAVCAGLISIGDLQNYAKVRPRLSDPKGLEATVSIPCPECGGQPLDPETCSKCGGSGSCPNQNCQGGRQVTPSLAGTAPMVIACMICKGTGMCPTCKGEGVVGATCPKCRGKGLVLDQDNARDIFRQYMDMAIAAARAKQVVLVEMTGSGTTIQQAARRALSAAVMKVHGKQKAAQALTQGIDAVVKAYAPVGTPTENADGTYSVKAKVCVVKSLPEAAPAEDDADFGSLGDAW